MRLLPILAVLAAALVSGCGGDEGSTAPETTIPTTTITESSPTPTTSDDPEAATTTDEADEADDTDGAGGERPQPESGAGAANALIAAAAVLTSDGTTEQACGSYVTEAFIRTSYGGETNCVAARRGEPLARSISVGPGDESSTRIVVVPKGGPYDGAEVEVDLVVEDGGYRVDRLIADIPAGP